jgi:hypothetical protein
MEVVYYIQTNRLVTDYFGAVQQFPITATVYSGMKLM